MSWNPYQPTMNYNSMLGQPFGQMLGGTGMPTGAMPWSQGLGDNIPTNAFDANQASESIRGMDLGGINPSAGTTPNGWKGWLSNSDNLGTIFSGIGALSSAYLGFKQMQNAKDALNLQKEAFNANLNNSIQTYNTSLEDRIRGRTSEYAGKEGDVQSYLSKHSLHR